MQVRVNIITMRRASIVIVLVEICEGETKEQQ